MEEVSFDYITKMTAHFVCIKDNNKVEMSFSVPELIFSFTKCQKPFLFYCAKKVKS